MVEACLNLFLSQSDVVLSDIRIGKQTALAGINNIKVVYRGDVTPLPARWRTAELTQRSPLRGLEISPSGLRKLSSDVHVRAVRKEETNHV